MRELLCKLRTMARVMENLPELPGSNGSVVYIYDTEACDIAAAIEASVEEIEKLHELVRLIFESTVPYNEKGECVFIDKVINMWSELTPNN